MRPAGLVLSGVLGAAVGGWAPVWGAAVHGQAGRRAALAARWGGREGMEGAGVVLRPGSAGVGGGQVGREGRRQGGSSALVRYSGPAVGVLGAVETGSGGRTFIGPMVLHTPTSQQHGVTHHADQRPGALPARFPRVGVWARTCYRLASATY